MLVRMAKRCASAPSPATRCHFGLYGAELLADLAQAGGVLASEQRQCQTFPAVLRRGPILDQSVARHKQLLEIAEKVAAHGACGQVQRAAHARQHLRVDPVGLGQLAGRLDEGPRMTRIDLHQGEASLRHRLLHRPVIAPGRLIDDPASIPDPAEQSHAASLISVEAAAFAIRQPVGVQMVF